MTTVPIRLKQVLHQAGEPLRAVYFLNGGAASIVTLLADGTMVEATTVGNEGMLGIEAFLGVGAVATGQTLMQVPDTDAERLSVEDFRREAAAGGALHELMGRYTQVILAQLMQSTACNARHEVPQRCARWLLMTHDRMQKHDFNLSHEFLAVMLGVSRPTVSVAAAHAARGWPDPLHAWAGHRAEPQRTGSGVLRVLRDHSRPFQTATTVTDRRFAWRPTVSHPTEPVRRLLADPSAAKTGRRVTFQ